MLQNKIYLNFIKEILKTFFVILFGLTIIAWTVRAVNFLDFVTEDGHGLGIYFKYTLLNLPKIISRLMPFIFFNTIQLFLEFKISLWLVF